MSRTLLPAFTSHLDGQILFLANMCLITRRDHDPVTNPAQFGFTSHDQDLVYDGVTYEAFSSVDATEVRQSAGGGVDNLTVVGLLKSDKITDVDLRAGLYDGAEVSLFQVNWADLSMGRLLVLTGTIGEISHQSGQYTAEVRSLSQRLSQQVVELTSSTCRVRALGDRRCLPPEDPTPSFDLEDYQHTRLVESAPSQKAIVFAGDTNPLSYYNYGRVRFNTGANANIEREIKSHTGGGARFDGTNSLSHADNADLSAGDIDFTLWARVNLTQKGSNRGVIGKLTTGAQTKWGLLYNTSLDRWQFTVWNTSSFAADANANNYGSPPLNTWATIICWHDAAANTVNIQVDNGAVNSTSYSTGTADEGLDFVIGDVSGGGWPFIGSIAEAGFAKRVLTAAEREDIFDGMVYAGYSTAFKVNLISQWPLNEMSDGSAPVTREDAHGSNDLTDNGNVESTSPTITLQEAFPFAVAVGDEALLEAGCDRTFETCRTKFSNSVNFAGEPSIPGVDQIQERGRR